MVLKTQTLTTLAALGVLLLAAGLFFTSDAPQVQAQGGSCGTTCGVPAGPCGAPPAGYSVRCVMSPTNTSARIGTCVCTRLAPTSTTNVTVAPDDTTTATKAPTQPPLSEECKNKCDLDGDGVISKRDFDPALLDTDPAYREQFNFCANSCPWENGENPGPLPPIDPSHGTGLLGDCSGTTAGQPDGAVDLRDLEYLRSELNNEVTTLACDFDQSGDVDVIDFANYLRPGYIEFNQQNPQPTMAPEEEPTTAPDDVPVVTPQTP